MTASNVAVMMASMLGEDGDDLRVLDPGAGVGSLFAAYVLGLCERDAKARPRNITVVAYEIDELMTGYLSATLDYCRMACEAAGIRFDGRLVASDFIASASEEMSLGTHLRIRFNRVILNPPYRKINAHSEERRLLRLAGVETTNLYTGFLALATKLLEPGGEMVAITPRSFCNGAYFRPFRERFLEEMELRRLHVFESRKHAFRGDDVLQENVILHALKRGRTRSNPPVVIESTVSLDEPPTSRTVPYDQVVRRNDPQHFIHIAAEKGADIEAERIASLPSTLGELGIKVSTGRVVDFRAKEYLRLEPEKGTAPLIWPTHFDSGYISWPKEAARKPQAILIAEPIENQLVPNEHYVLVRRFSAKEGRRRVVAALYDPSQFKTRVVGFENHLNYFHNSGRGLEPSFAKGLAAFLNSTLVDTYFRQFNGHTQVNATDLMSLRYPSPDQLRAIGSQIGSVFPEQEQVDGLVLKVLGLGPTRAAS